MAFKGFGGNDLQRPTQPALTPEVLKALIEQDQGPGFFSQVGSAGLGLVGKALDFLGHTGYAARSALRGEFLDAAQHGVEFGADLVTGGMASDLYKHYAGEEFTTKAESPEFTDLMESYLGKGYRPTGWKGFAADVVGGALTDPLTYLTAGAGSAVGVGKNTLAGVATAGQARSLLSRSLLQTTKGAAALKSQIGSQAADDVLKALNTGSLRGLMESSLNQVDDAAEAVFRKSLAGPYRLTDDFFANVAQNQGVIDDAVRSMFDQGLLQRGGLNFMGKRIPGSEAIRAGLPTAVREGAAPAFVGEGVGGLLGLPPGLGGLAAVGARRAFPKARVAVDDFADEAWSTLTSKVYDKFSDLKIPQQLRETARQFELKARGANREANEAAVRVFDGVTPQQKEAMFDVLAKVETQVGKAKTPVLRNMATLMATDATGLPREQVQEILGQVFASFEKQQDELIDLGMFTSRGAERPFYVPHAMKPEVGARFRDAGVDPYKLYSPTAARRSATLEGFEASIRELAKEHGVELGDMASVAVRDLGELFRVRQLSHNETMWKEGLKKHMVKYAGATESFGADTAIDRYTKRLLEPMSGRKGVQKVLAQTNRFTKPLQTIYNIPFHIRNMVSTWGQVLIDPAMTLKDSVKIMGAQIGDMPLLRVLSKKVAGREEHKVYKFLKAANNPTDLGALKAASEIKIGRYTGDQVLSYAKRGVIQNNFGEEVLEELGSTLKLVHGRLRQVEAQPPAGLIGKVHDKVTRAATSASAYIEDRARLTAFVSMLEEGIPAEEAIRRTQKAFVDYSVQSELDRFIRDVIPYARFTVGNTPVAIEGALRRPGMTGLTANVAAAKSVQSSDPLAPEEARAGFAVNLGGGNFLGGFGMPLQAAGETLNNLSSLEGARRLLGQTAMPINLPLQAATNRNFYFGGDFLRPTRMPDSMPAVGPVRETTYGGKELSPGASAVLFSGPFSRQAGMLRTLGEGSLPQIVAKLVTGVGVRTTDEERAVRTVVERWLDDAVKRGDVGRVQSFFQRGTGEEAEEAVRLWLQLRRAERERRKKG